MIGKIVTGAVFLVFGIWMLYFLFRALSLLLFII
jgi:hypothetical protein